MSSISKINLKGDIYSLKDASLTSRVSTVEDTIKNAATIKGKVSSASQITSLVSYKTGWTYVATADFTIPNVGVVETGDFIVAISDYNNAYAASDWRIAQANVTIMTGATTSAAGTKGLVPAPAAADRNNFLKGDGTWGQPDSALSWGSFSDLN